MATRERIVDFDGIPHNADTGEPLPGNAVEPRTHWIDELPATSLDGIVLVTSPNDMVFSTRLWSWMRRDEFERLQAGADHQVFDYLADEFAARGQPRKEVA